MNTALNNICEHLTLAYRKQTKKLTTAYYYSSMWLEHVIAYRKYSLIYTEIVLNWNCAPKSLSNRLNNCKML